VGFDGIDGALKGCAGV